MKFIKEDIINFAKQYDTFQKRCEHVANIFAKYDCDYKYTNHDWELDYNDEEDASNQQIFISNEADIYARGCWVDTVTVSLPIEVLSYTDEQIEEYAGKRFRFVQTSCNT